MTTTALTGTDARLRDTDRADPDIAADAVRALRLRPVPESVQVAVHNGYVTLTGTVEWILQQSYPEEAVSRIPGVRGVVNHIEVRRPHEAIVAPSQPHDPEHGAGDLC